MMDWKWLKWIFTSKRKREELREERLSEQIIHEDEERLREAYEKEIPATIITYTQSDDETQPPIMNALVDDFSGAMMPEPNSIIWIGVEGFLRPFKVVRYDYIQNSSEYDSMRVYIVVQPAPRSEIVPNHYYGLNS